MYRKVLLFLLISATVFVQPISSQKSKGKWGFIRPDGTVAIPAIFDHASMFSDDLALVSIGQRMGFIDRSGKQVIPFLYSQAYPFKNGVASVMIAGQSAWILINTKGERLGTKTFSSPLHFSEGLAEFRENSKTGYVDLNGNVAIEPGDFLGGPFGNGLAAITLKKGYAFIDKTGKIALPGPYEQTDGFRSGYARIRVKNKEALIDTKGKYFLPPKYFAVSSFTEGLAGVKTSSKAAGFVDETGKMVIQPKWHFAMPFENGYSVVVVNDRFGVINKSGETVIPIEYSDIGQRRSGIFRAMKDGKLYVLKSDGSIFTQEEVRFISIVGEGLIAYQNNAQKYGFLNASDGSVALPPLYCSFGSFDGSLAPVQFCD
jgi:hypothetical protein